MKDYRPTSGTVRLREITPDNEAAVRALAVAPGQELLIDPVSASLDEAASTPDARPWYRAIYARVRLDARQAGLRS